MVARGGSLKTCPIMQVQEEEGTGEQEKEAKEEWWVQMAELCNLIREDVKKTLQDTNGRERKEDGVEPDRGHGSDRGYGNQEWSRSHSSERRETFQQEWGRWGSQRGPGMGFERMMGWSNGGRGGSPGRNWNGEMAPWEARRWAVICHRCGGQGHYANMCPSRGVMGGGGRGNGEGRQIVCFRCRQEGHIAAQCTTNMDNAVGPQPENGGGDGNTSDFRVGQQ